MSQMRIDDRDNTIALLKKNRVVIDNKTWLRHTADSESGLIDLMVLEGRYTIIEMIDLLSKKTNLKQKSKSQWEKRIRDHLLHLSTSEGDSRNKASGQGGHNLPIIERPGGTIKFDL